MRIRTIKPDFFKSEKIAELPFEVRLLFIGLWGLADKDGRLEDRPKRIKAELFPYDEINVESALALLAGWGFIQRYEVEGTQYIEVVNFRKHQHISGKEADGKSLIPPNPNPGNNRPGSMLEPSQDSTGTNPELTRNAKPTDPKKEQGLPSPNLNLAQDRNRPGTIPEQGKDGAGIPGKERKGKEDISSSVTELPVSRKATARPPSESGVSAGVSPVHLASDPVSLTLDRFKDRIPSRAPNSKLEEEGDLRRQLIRAQAGNRLTEVDTIKTKLKNLGAAV